MPLVTTECIILKSHPYSETSKILRVLTRDHGVRSVIAKGALRPRSRYGGVLEPFAIGVATIYLSERSDLHTLGGFDLSRAGLPLGRDLVRFGTASLLTEIVLRAGSEESDPILYERLRSALERIESVPSNLREPVGLAESWALVAHLGFAPILDRCTYCEEELSTEEDAFFDHDAGGTRCLACGGSSAVSTRRLPSHARQVLRRFLAGEPVEPQRTAAHWALLARFLTYHLGEGGELHSLQFLGEAVGIGGGSAV